MRLRIMLATVGALAVGAVAVPSADSAAPTSPHLAADSFTFKSNKDLEDVAIRPGVAGASLGVLSDHENYFVEVVGRTQTGEPEFHAHWIDYAVVQEGHGSLLYGGTDTGSRDIGNGESRGGTISGGASRDLNPGDYFEMPAGEWHQIILKPGTKAFRYLVVKIRQ